MPKAIVMRLEIALHVLLLVCNYYSYLTTNQSQYLNERFQKRKFDCQGHSLILPISDVGVSFAI